MYDEYQLWMDLQTRIMKKVEKKGDCLLWVGTKNKAGYGRIRFEGRLQSVHKLVYRLQRLSKAEIMGQFIHHSCGNRACLNETHMFLTRSRR